ncbi:hypothetical protein KKC94_01410 [Patescibacteria group bacterium]|nr:hypothetical protein [Patescibacteria group bacterium]
MKNALLLAGLAGCGGLENQIISNENSQDAEPSSYEAHLGACEDRLNAGPIPYDHVFPGSLPLDVSYFDDKAVFREVFTKYRDQLKAVLALPLMGGGFEVMPTQVDRDITELEYTNDPVLFENGDFVVVADFGYQAGVNGDVAAVLITNDGCMDLYGYATYLFTGNHPVESKMLSYMDENGDIVEL